MARFSTACDTARRYSTLQLSDHQRERIPMLFKESGDGKITLWSCCWQDLAALSRMSCVFVDDRQVSRLEQCRYFTIQHECLRIQQTIQNTGSGEIGGILRGNHFSRELRNQATLLALHYPLGFLRLFNKSLRLRSLP
jgi:hypothetical protein